MSLSLVRALRAGISSRLAFVGAGGKTTAMFHLARKLNKEQNTPVIVTVTSHLGAWQIPFADMHIIAELPSILEENKHTFKGVILITGNLDGEKTNPINDRTLNWIHQYCDEHSFPILIEADGSRQMPLKAWNDHEPPIPAFVNHVVQVVGITGIEKILNHEHVHRPEVFSSLSGLNIGEPVTTAALIQVLKHVKGGLKNIPKDARRSVLLNRSEERRVGKECRSRWARYH